MGTIPFLWAWLELAMWYNHFGKQVSRESSLWGLLWRYCQHNQALDHADRALLHIDRHCFYVFWDLRISGKNAVPQWRILEYQTYFTMPFVNPNHENLQFLSQGCVIYRDFWWSETRIFPLKAAADAFDVTGGHLGGVALGQPRRRQLPFGHGRWLKWPLM